MLLLGIALAGDRDEGPGKDDDWIPLEVEADFGSALEHVDEAQESLEAQETPSITTKKEKRHRARWYVRPRLAFVGLNNGWTMTGGAVVGHQWWALKERRVRPVGETQLRGLETPLGVLPGEESASLLVGVLGWTLGVEQRLSYDGARSCLSQ